MQNAQENDTINRPPENQEIATAAAESDNSPAPSASAHKNEPPPKKSKSFLEKYSLRISGLLNLVGDLGFLQSGLDDLKHKRPGAIFEVGAGGLYTLGALNIALFGTQKENRSKEEIVRETLDHIEGKEGSHANKEKATGFLQKYAGQNTMLLYTLGAFSMLVLGIKKFMKDKSQWGDIGYGISSLTFKALTLLVPEKKTNTEPKTILDDGVIAWFKDQPLRIFGYGSMLSDGMIIRSALEKKSRGENYGYKMLTGFTYVISDLMASMSRKEQVNDAIADTEKNDITDKIAQEIANKPKQEQEALTNKAAAYLKEQPEIQEEQQTIAEKIKQKLGHRASGKWSDTVNSPGASQFEVAI